MVASSDHRRMAGHILTLSVWAASSLVAIDSATLWPTFLTPFLTHERFAPLVSTAMLAVLVSAAPTAHITGKLAINQYKLWNPFRGGARFACLQAAGWTLCGTGCLILGLDLMGWMQARTPASPPGFTPGFLIGVAVSALAGNALLVASLSMYDSSERATREARTYTSIVYCLLPCLFSAVAIASLLALGGDSTSSPAALVNPAFSLLAACVVGTVAALVGTLSLSAPAAQTPKKVSVSSPFGATSFTNLLSAMLFPFVAAGFITISLIEMLMYYGSLMLWPGSGPPSAPRPGLRGEQPIEVFDPAHLATADWSRLRHEYVHRGVPFILRRPGGAPLSTVAPPEEAVRGAFATGNIRVGRVPWFAKLDGLDELITSLLPYSPRAYWPFWFLGNYSQGTAHVDLGPHTFNCYYMRKGSKDVLLAPPEVAKSIPLAPGIDGLFVPGSADEERRYAKALPYYYRVDLLPESMLCFNNTSTLHQFRNHATADGSNPEALSVRIKHTCCGAPRVWAQMSLPWRAAKAWWRFSGVFISFAALGDKSEDREAKYI